MLETLRCPSCSTRYGLNAARVHPGIRRAQCFRCTTVFDIEGTVARLLAPAGGAPLAEPMAELMPLPEPMPEFVPEPRPEFVAEPMAGFVAEPMPEFVAEPMSGFVPELEPELELELEPVAAALPPSLTLGDLDGVEEELLDPAARHEPAPARAPEAEAEASPNGGSGYASAKDAIARLMGDPLPPKPQQRSLARAGGMDVEATLSALEDTLGGQRVFEPEPAPAPAPEAAPVTTASTMRLTLSEIQAALASATPAPAGGGAGAYGSNPEPAGADPRFAAAATMPPGFILPPLTVPRNEAATHQVPVPPPSLAAQQDPNLLKIQLDQEIYNNVTLEQMSAWVDEGRVHEFDMVARQFSEHWIEANKVPALRPIFEQRRRRQGGEAAEVPIPPSEILPPKKGIFGGLFGRS